MMDEIYDRQYQAGRAELHAGLDRAFARLARGVADTFQVLHRIEWSAPWNDKSKKAARG